MPAKKPLKNKYTDAVGAVNDFLKYFNAHDVPDLMNTFGDNPLVGVTSYGPQFRGYSDVQRLFRQLIVSFQSLALTQQGNASPPQDDWLFDKTKTVVGIQMIFSGLHVAGWFAKATPHYSPPLSDIVPNSTHAMDLDASVIFYTDASNNYLISRVSIYFDRYLLSQQLATISKGSSNQGN